MMRFLRFLLVLVGLFACGCAAVWSAPLVLTFSVAGTQVRVDAELAGQKKTYVLPYRSADFAQRLDGLYAQLEEKKYTRKKVLPILQTLGSAVYGPIGPMIDSSSEIQYVIPPSFVKYPLDLLLYKNRFLFLSRPVSYSFGRMASRAFPLTTGMRALIVSDPSADPENGCAYLKKLLPSSRYFKIDQLTPDRFKTLGPADVLLVSAHGDVSFDDTDCMKMGKKDIEPQHLAAVRAKLVYLDSCQTGASQMFIDAFKKSGTQFYLAPIVSNEAGNSSTKTIRLFFSALQQGQPPPQALFGARTQLYKEFVEDEEFPDLLWKAFPFRVYRLN